MHPILFSIGSFQLYSYGLFMALGLLAGLWVVDSEAKRLKWDRDKMTRLVVLVFVLGLLGARVLYIGTRLPDPSTTFWDLITNFRSGFVYYGGYAASWLTLIVYLFQHKKEFGFWDVCDAFVMGICIGLAIGRIGCFLGGCCFGSPTDCAWGVEILAERALGKLHPVQLYEFFGLLVVMAVLWWRRTNKKYPGELVVWYTIIYSIFRYVLEFYRGDHIRGFIIEPYLSTSQFIGLIFLPLGIWLHFYLKKRPRIFS